MLSLWASEVGVCTRTVQRWRTTIVNGSPMLDMTSNIRGFYFVTAEADKKFWERAAKGEFHKEIRAIGESGELSADSPLVKVAKRRGR